MKIKNAVYPATIALTLLSAVSTLRADDPVPKWESSAAAGLTLTRGNSDTLLGTLTFATAKKWDQNELGFGADGAYGQNKQNGTTDTTTEQLHGFGQYNRLFTERWYGYGRIEGLHDGVAEIRYRLTLSPGAGYYFIKNKETDLSAEAGPGLIVQRLGSTDSSYFTLRLGEKFHQALSDRARVWQTFEFLPQVDNFNNYIINFEVGIEADLSSSKKLALRAYLQDTYNNVPAKGRLKNDAKLVTAIAYKF